MNVLAIGAHFDDIELGCGGTIAKHVANNDNVTLYVVTNSQYGNYDGKIYRTAEVALEEGKRAAKILGGRLLYSSYETKTLTYGTDLIENINKIIDSVKPDLVYTHWDADVHQDHAAVGKATISAARHIPRILMYRSNWYDTTKIFRGTFFVDITPFIKVKIRAIKANKTEYKRRGKSWINFFLNENLNNGQRIGVKYAEVFEVVKFLL